MTREERMALSREILENMDMTKEQYLEMCKLCDELDLSVPPPDPEDMSWEDIIDRVDN